MRRNRVELERLHLALLEVFRTVPSAGDLASFKFAAERSKCSVRIAKRAYEIGWPGFRRIADVLAEEQLLARASISREDIATRIAEATEAARDSAVESRKRAGALIVAEQRALAELLGAFYESQVRPLSERVLNGEQVEVGPLALTLRNLVGTAAELLRQEASILGEPSATIALTVEAAQAEVTIEDARQELEAAQRALQEVEGRSSIEASDASGPAILH